MTLFAYAAAPANLGQAWLEIATPYLILAGVLAGLMAFVLWYRRSVKDAADRITASELLTQAREWEEEGDLTEEEYRKLKMNLSPELRQLGPPPKGKGDPARRRPPQNP